MVELRVLHYFLAIAREENFTKAAEQLHVTQPTLSRQIAQLEKELGVQLFRRSNHHIVLTEDGMILKRRAQEILSLADTTKREFLHKDENLVGMLTIGGGEFLSTRYLADCIAAFRMHHPRVDYELYSGNAEHVCERIDRGLLDIGLMAEPIDMQKYACVTMPVQEVWGVWARNDSPLASKQYITPQDLVDVALILPASEVAYNSVSTWLGEYASRIDAVITGNLLYNEAMMAQSGIGAILGLALHCTYEGLRFIPLQPALTMSTALAWKKEQRFSIVTTAFITFAQQYFKSISSHA